MERSHPQVVGPLSPHLDSFAALLEHQGYSRQYACLQIRLVADFSRWLMQEHVAAPSITIEHIRAFLHYRAQSRRLRRGDVSVLRRMVDMLRQDGVLTQTSAPIEETPVQRVVAAYAAYLGRERKLATATLNFYLPFVNALLTERFGIGPATLSDLCAADIVRFVQRQAAHLIPKRAKVMTSALRSFLRYAQYCGDVPIDLAAAVPTVPNWSMTSIPRAIAAEDVRTVLAHCDRQTAVGRRDYAILLLLARLGLRSGEVVALTLDSLDWESSCISVQGKGGHPARLPLPPDVGEAIALYLRQGRPASFSRALFLRARAPIRPFRGPCAISSVVKHAIIRAGIALPHQGAHQFRHGLACEMLRQGATLTEIGELLRHRWPQTTTLYAKVDLAALRTLSLPWPEGA